MGHSPRKVSFSGLKASWEIRKTLFSFLFSPLDFKTKFRQAENIASAARTGPAMTRRAVSVCG